MGPYGCKKTGGTGKARRESWCKGCCKMHALQKGYQKPKALSNVRNDAHKATKAKISDQDHKPVVVTGE